MLKTLPFSALRTLEAVVRLRGFSRAAEELNVTQSAVSQHIKQLEEWLGLRLMVRRGRSVTPTDAGERLARVTRDGYSAIADTCDDLRDSTRNSERNILVASPPGFAFLWLLPRLLRFDELHPDLPVSLSTDPQSRDVLTAEADVIICYGPGGYSGFHAEPLMAEQMTPVCAPSIATRVTSVNDLANHVILLDRLDDGSSMTNWDFWAQEVGVTLPRFSQTRELGQANLVIQAAMDGGGIAMGRSPLIKDALDSGRLVQPFDKVAQSQLSYWLVCRREALKRDRMVKFLDWIRAEV
ncbi:LysR substrate-binding domain-containing protein [Aliiroseovarius sp. 2305UL8-7]|uniref:LysR substrate-binding domain-containing protein n=1 Tax=Aliiroseovarius conchicola TaxID=3121637 RepID=UPI00352962D7